MRNPEWWRRQGLRPLSVLDASGDVRSMKTFISRYSKNPANVVAADLPQGMVPRLGSKEADDTVALFEKMFDYGSELSECYYGNQAEENRSIFFLLETSRYWIPYHLIAPTEHCCKSVSC